MARLSYANGRISAAGYGSRAVKIERIGFGMEIVATEGTARHHRAFYTTRRIPSDFSIMVVCTSEAEYEDLTGFLRGYARAMTDSDATVSQVMRVTMPGRDFDLSGTPAMVIPFGISVGDFVWRFPINFLGTHDPSEVAPHTSAMLAVPPEAVYYYPGGTQLAGTEHGTDFAYNYELATGDVDALAGGGGGGKRVL